MSDISGVGSSAASYYANLLQQIEQRLFSKIDANGDGSVTKPELENAVGNAGGSTQSADALFSLLDPSNTGSVSAQQFAQNLPLPSYSAEIGALFIADQAQASTTAPVTDPATQSKEALFTQLDANGDGTLTKPELEQAVTAAGGTTASADALYAKLDPNNTGGVSEQQFVQNLPGSHHHFHHHHHGSGEQTADNGNDAITGQGTATSGASGGSDGTSADDALLALLDSLFQPTATNSALTTGGGTSPSGAGSDPVLSASTSPIGSVVANPQTVPTTATDTSQGSASVQNASGSTGTNLATSGNSADDALLALLDAQGNGTNAGASTSATGTAPATSATASPDSTPAALFGKISQEVLALMLQIQSQSLTA
jgi:Ca2+-binding EF-hand superfamily protein